MTKPQTMLMQAEEFLAFRQQLGYKLVREGYLLLEFGRYADKSGHKGPITSELALRWVRLPQNGAQNYLAQRLNVVSRLARHQALTDRKTEIPTNDNLKLRRVQPYIYSKQQITNLLAAAAQLSPVNGLRPRTYRTLFGLLASTGIRVGEAIRLQNDQVNLKQGVLQITNTKFSKSRLVPVHKSTLNALRQYAAFRNQYRSSRKSTAFLLAESRRTVALRHRQWDIRRSTHAFGMESLL